MAKKIKHNKDLFLETGIRKSFDGYEAWFRVDNQTFYSKDFETKAEAKWYAEMMDIAFDNIRKHVLRGAGVYLKDDFNPAFLEIAESIKKSISRKK